MLSEAVSEAVDFDTKAKLFPKIGRNVIQTYQRSSWDPLKGHQTKLLAEND